MPSPRPITTLIAQAWDRLWFSPVDPLPPALFRLFLGGLIAWMFVCLYPSWEYYYGLSGVLSLNDPTLQAKEVRDWWCVFSLTDRWGVPFITLWGIGLAASLAFTVGFQTRLASIVLYVLITSIIHRNRMGINGEDLVFRMLLLYCCFAPLNYTLSVDEWLRRWRLKRRGLPVTDRPRPAIWAIRMMQIQIALIYVISLPNKMVDDVAWRNGQAIYLAMVSNLWSRQLFLPLFYNGFLSKVATYGTILTEGSFPILVWFRKPRLYVIAAVAGMHIGIAIFLKHVAFFSLAMVCSFWLFVPGDTIRWVAARRNKLGAL